MSVLKLKRQMQEWRRPIGMNDLTQDETTAALHYSNRMQRTLRVREALDGSIQTPGGVVCGWIGKWIAE